MTVDLYSLCPGGTGKKIKFCCRELAGDLEGLSRMMLGEQHAAALQQVEGLLKTHPDKACLLAIQTELLRNMDRQNEAAASAAKFLALHPQNPIALAESAMAAAADGRSRDGLIQLHQALAVSETQIYATVYEALGELAHSLLIDGAIRAAMSLLHIRLTLNPEEADPLGLLFRLEQSPAIPVLVKQERPLADCPASVPWKSRFDTAVKCFATLDFLGAEREFASLAAEVGDAPAIWSNLAMLRAWLADAAGAIEALRRYAALDVPLEDAVEAEALAMLLSEDPLGDHLDGLLLVYPVSDAEHLEAALASSPRTIAVRSKPASQPDEEPPPKATFVLLDRAKIDAAVDATVDDIPQVLGQAMLFGKQTDREARLEIVGASASTRADVEALAASWGEAGLGAGVEAHVVGRISASRALVRPAWQLPTRLGRPRMKQLLEELEGRTLLERWPQLKLGALDGKTPAEAAADPAHRVRLLAAIMVLDAWNSELGGQFDFNLLRAKLGLPTLGPINPASMSVKEIPLTRLHRLEVEKLSDEDLLYGYRRAMVYALVQAVGRFGRELIARPTLAGRDESREALGVLAQVEQGSDQALGYIDRGRKAAEAAGKSSASWDLLELSSRLDRGEDQEVVRLVDHLQTQHLREPGVAQALMQLLVSLGVVRPGAAVPGAPEDVMAGPAEAEPSKLWTPDSVAAPGEKPTIWTPGMD